MSEWKLVPVEPTDAMCAAAIGASLKDPESINGLPQYRAMIAAAPIPEQVAPTAWLATDLDGRGDVAFTKEEAKRRAGEGCTEFFPLHDLAPTTSTVSATAEESRKEADWARAVAFASANQNASTMSASGALAAPDDVRNEALEEAALAVEDEVPCTCCFSDDEVALAASLAETIRAKKSKSAARIDRAAQAATDKSED